ncbi:hypothetical protein M2371_001918 [Buttiauxella sp. BIGb0471]|uniref:toxin YdaT domain-containing protein n=1 Tax=Buttiauxella sp. BIGb0471 TaxID=2940597 RepID=UPI0021693AA4|nr:toxin YdaT domain-containing protein [Buttiauxella sp. BIGb0471]MCS3602709.1 hypothetical protein [Buttiauxella sp. BIGb0471]
MQTLRFQNDSSHIKSGLIFQNQFMKASDDSLQHRNVCAAVRAWASRDGQLTAADEVRKEWERSGERGLNVPSDSDVWKVKFFRWLDNPEGSTKYRTYIKRLMPAIMAVLPLEFRVRLVPEDNIMMRLARLEKETSEAKVAVALDAPTHQKLKELSEGIVEMFRVDPALTGPLYELVTSMLGVI